MVFDILKKCFFRNDYVVNTKIVVLRQNQNVKNGVISAGKSTFEDVDLAETARLYKSSDFDIANLIEVGAYEMLKPTYVSSLSSMTFADRVQTITSNLSKDVQE